MAVPQTLVIRAPGTNCDAETAYAFQQAGATTQTLHINRLRENPRLLDSFQILCIPGGFSYGDDVAAGRILACQLRHHLSDALYGFRDAGKLILGICNGFQVLLKTGLLADEDDAGSPATLATNESLKFEDRWVRLQANGEKCVFLAGIQELQLPVAHAEGRFVSRDSESFTRLENAGQLVLRYVSASNEVPETTVCYPANPNGSIGNVAGMCDATGRVLGLMPHPERFISPTQHPCWTRREGASTGDGLPLFVNAVRYFL